MLMRTDPFRELDRLTQQVFGTNGTLARPSVMPMDAWRDGDTFHVEFDLPGVDPDSIDLDVERHVVTVKAERAARRPRHGPAPPAPHDAGRPAHPGRPGPLAPLTAPRCGDHHERARRWRSRR